METCKDLIPLESFPWHGKVILRLFIFFGSILFAVTIGLHYNPTANFNCNPDKTIAADITQKTFIQTSCLSKYEEKYNSPVPLHWCILLSFGLVVSLSLVYAVGVKSRIEKFDTSKPSAHDAEQQQQSSASGHRLSRSSCVLVFYFYIAQLLFARYITTTLFAGLVFFPAHYPTEFSCLWSSPSSNMTDFIRGGNLSYMTVECTSLIGSSYKISAMVAGVVNTVCALLALLEAIYLIWKVCGNKSFSNDHEFCSVYLLRKKEEHHITEDDQKKRFDNIRDNYKDWLKTKDRKFKMDIHYVSKGNLHDMYVPLIIQQERDRRRGAGMNRHDIYHTYLDVPNKSLLVHDIEDLFENTTQPPQKIIVIGRPGIGKSVLARKIMFNWRMEARQFYHEKIVILLNFRSFNSEQEKSLKEMMKFGVTLPNEDNVDFLIQYILENPEKVLLIFDGLDELKVDSDCFEKAEDSPNNCSKPMSIFSVWNKLISGKFLPGATVITTSRPTADHIYSNLDFDQTLEILGFTKPEIQKYVQNFCDSRKVEHEVIWRYIEGSAELLSLCYVPVNNFIVCLTLERCNKSEAGIPTTLTELYKRATRILLWDHYPACKSVIKQKDYLNSDKYFPEEVIKTLDKLKTVAKMGMENNRLIFNRENISDIENCGLFNSLPNEYESQFCFLHLTLQEYLAAWKLVDDCNQPDNVKRVLSKYLGKPRWYLVIQFFAGLLGDKVKEGKLSRECYNCFSERISSDTEDWEEKDVLLMIKCLHELQDAEIIASSGGKVVCREELGIALDCTTCEFFPADCTALSQFLLHVKNLHRLDLSGQTVGVIGCLEFVKVFTRTCNEVVAVNLRRNKITDEGLIKLSEAVENENCKLTSIDLEWNEITDAGVKDLSKALNNENCKLTSLDLSANAITDDGVKHVSEALKNENCKLTSIDLSDIEITVDGVKDLSEALKNKNCKLTSINLSYNSIIDDGVKDLSKALNNENCKLTSIDLSANEITDDGVKHVSEALKNKNCKLTSIELRDNRITDDGVKDLSEALKNKNCKLTSIDLRKNRITDNGVKDLSESLNNENCKLTSIELYDNYINGYAS